MASKRSRGGKNHLSRRKPPRAPRRLRKRTPASFSTRPGTDGGLSSCTDAARTASQRHRATGNCRENGCQWRNSGARERRNMKDERMNWRGEVEAGCRANLVQGEATDGGKQHPAIDTLAHSGVPCNCSGENHGKALDNSICADPAFFWTSLRQSASLLRVQPVPVGFRPSGRSSGEPTSAGASNSQSTHRAQATDGDKHTCSALAETVYPVFALLSLALSILVSINSKKIGGSVFAVACSTHPLTPTP